MERTGTKYTDLDGIPMKRSLELEGGRLDTNSNRGLAQYSK